MKIIIRHQSELPIYAQIEEQIKEQILGGDLPEGTLLPSIRKLAREINVSVITTTRAYSDLERDGFITSIQGKGSIVLPQNNSLLRAQYRKRLEDMLTSAVHAARAIHMEKAEIHTLLNALWDEEENQPK